MLNNHSLILSVIVPSYNSENTIKFVLIRLIEELDGINYEIIVSDSSSSKEVGKICSTFPEVTFLYSDKHLLPGTARNVGAKAAKGEILLFLDADCIPERGWGKIIKSKIFPYKYERKVFAGAFGNGTPNALIGSVHYWIELSEFSPWICSGEKNFLPTGNIFIPKAIFWELNGFNTKINMAEDLLFSQILKSKGVKLYFIKELVVFHINRTSYKLLVKQFRKMGIWSGWLRANFPEMPGGIMKQYPILLPALFPLRFFRLAKRLFLAKNISIYKKILFLVLAIPLLCVWNEGFAEGILFKKIRNLNY